MLVESMENRILVGMVAFMGMIVILGWVAINEQGRMRAFERQFNARSIERGATTYISTCATCHGPDGRGILGRAPGLNNPQLFGNDFLALIDNEITTLTDERDGGAASQARIAEIDARLAELETERGALLEAMAPAIRRGYNPEEPERLEQVAWSAGLEDFLIGTLTSGRPVSNSYWPQPMPAWGQSAGGPLRSDQIADVVRYVMNWDRAWTLDDLNSVSQFAIEPCDPNNPASCPGLEVADGGAGAGGELTADSLAGTDVQVLLTALETVQGNPQDGQQSYNATFGCAGCHVGGAGATAPALDGTFTRAQETRLQDPALADHTARQYLIESIVDPGAYVAPGYSPIMPPSFGAQITVQQLADLIAYLESQDGPSPE